MPCPLSCLVCCGAMFYRWDKLAVCYREWPKLALYIVEF